MEGRRWKEEGRMRRKKEGREGEEEKEEEKGSENEVYRKENR